MVLMGAWACALMVSFPRVPVYLHRLCETKDCTCFCSRMFSSCSTLALSSASSSSCRRWASSRRRCSSAMARASSSLHCLSSASLAILSSLNNLQSLDLRLRIHPKHSKGLHQQYGWRTRQTSLSPPLHDAPTPPSVSALGPACVSLPECARPPLGRWCLPSAYPRGQVTRQRHSEPSEPAQGRGPCLELGCWTLEARMWRWLEPQGTLKVQQRNERWNNSTSLLLHTGIFAPVDDPVMADECSLLTPWAASAEI